MNSDILNIIVTAVVGLISTAIGAIASYKGAKGQIEIQREAIEEQKEALAKKEEENMMFVRRMVEAFIIDEIESNYLKISSIREYLEKNYVDFKSNTTPQVTYRKDFQTEEFDRLKYDLIKFQSTLINKIKDFYHALFILEHKEQLNQITEQEFLFLRESLIFANQIIAIRKELIYSQEM
ncbi:hypothetical protein [Priestia koreensis]|uniref:hypothetical protein n=1 Tax=Priestia koreensis TaxID=284581 RepID=UPI003019D873